MKTNNIANEIYKQLGGSRFCVMTGAKNFIEINNGIRFNIGRNSSKANVVKVILKSDDTYTLQFWKQPREINPYLLMVKYYEQGMSNEQIEAKVQEQAKKSEPKMLEEYNGVYFDQLEELFTSYTGMYTRL